MDKFLKLLILLSLIMTTSCSMFDRRDHEMVMDQRFDNDMWVPEQDFPVIPGDSGRAYRDKSELLSRVPATARDQKEREYFSSLSQEIIQLENKLSEREYDDYLKIKPQLGGLSEQIYFLRLSYRDKLEYIQSRGIRMKESYTVQSFGRSAYQAGQPVGIGMSKTEVIERWGSPVQREYAGSPVEQNEKWSYRVNGTVKHIYFEQGRVEGWTEQ